MCLSNVSVPQPSLPAAPSCEMRASKLGLMRCNGSAFEQVCAASAEDYTFAERQVNLQRLR